MRKVLEMAAAGSSVEFAWHWGSFESVERHAETQPDRWQWRGLSERLRFAAHSASLIRKNHRWAMVGRTMSCPIEACDEGRNRVEQEHDDSKGEPRMRPLSLLLMSHLSLALPLLGGPIRD